MITPPFDRLYSEDLGNRLIERKAARNLMEFSETFAGRNDKYVYALKCRDATPGVGTLLRIYTRLYDEGHMDLAAEVQLMMRAKAGEKRKAKGAA